MVRIGKLDWRERRLLNKELDKYYKNKMRYEDIGGVTYLVKSPEKIFAWQQAYTNEYV